MSKAAKLDVIEKLHAKVAEVLMTSLDEDPTAQMIAQALKFLKDNGIEPARDADHSALNALSDKIGEIASDPEALRDFLN